MFQLILKAYQEVAVMYALGQKRTGAAHKTMSAKCQKRTSDGARARWPT